MLNVEKITILKVDACNLSNFITEEYGFKEFNIPYSIMQNDNMIEVRGVCSDQIDPKRIKEFNEKGYRTDSMQDLLEELLCDLCFQGKIEAGDYILEFDD